MESGNLEFAGYCITEYCDRKMLIVEDLNLVEKETGKYLQSSQKSQLEYTVHYISLQRQAALNLCGTTVDPCHLIGDSFNELKTLLILIEAKSFFLVYLVYHAKVMLNFLFGNYEEALEN